MHIIRAPITITYDNRIPITTDNRRRIGDTAEIRNIIKTTEIFKKRRRVATDSWETIVSGT